MPWVTVAGAVVGGVVSSMGDDGGGGGQATEQTQTATNGQATYVPNEALMPAYGSTMGTLNALAQTPQQYFPGQTYVDPSALTQQAVTTLQDAGNQTYKAADYYNLAGNQAGYATDAYNKGAGLYGQGADMLAGSAGAMQGVADVGNANYNFLSGAADVANNPYVQDMMAANQRQVLGSLWDEALPGLQQNAIGVNALGSSRLGLAQGQAVGDSMEALANANANTQMNAYTAGLQAQQAALGQTGSMQSAFGAPGQAVMSAGAGYGSAGGLMDKGAASYAQAGANAMAGANALGTGANFYGAGGQTVEGYQQAALDDAIARYNFQYEEPWNRVSNTIGALQGLANTGTNYTASGGTGTGTATDADAQSDWQTTIGGATTGAGLANYFYG